MVRTIIVPDQQDVSIHLPQQFVGKKVEVIAFSIEEVQKDSSTDVIMTHLVSESALAKDWSTDEEDSAWQNL